MMESAKAALPPIEKSYLLPYPLEVVYAAWISSDTVIAPATSMEVSPVVGGHYTLNIDSPDGHWRADGVFDIVEPANHVRYGWQWDGDVDATQIDVRFSSEGGGTRVTISHTGFTNPDGRANHDSGWDSYITGFIAHLEKPGRH